MINGCLRFIIVIFLLCFCGEAVAQYRYSIDQEQPTQKRRLTIREYIQNKKNIRIQRKHDSRADVKDKNAEKAAREYRETKQTEEVQKRMKKSRKKAKKFNKSRPQVDFITYAEHKIKRLNIKSHIDFVGFKIRQGYGKIKEYYGRIF